MIELIDSKKIFNKANSLIKTYCTRNPIEIAEATGIQIFFVDYFRDLLGMYANQWRTRAIFLNNRMDEYLTLMVAAHELGHDIFHREDAKKEGLQEFELFRMYTPIEYEANAFASHLLIDTDECLSLAKEGYDVASIAKITNSEINLILIKLQEMQRLGYDIHPNMTPNSKFFKKIKA